MKMRPLNYTPWYNNQRTLTLLIIFMPLVGLIGLIKTTLISRKNKLLMIPAFIVVVLGLVLFLLTVSYIL
ncbi:hypothetical protein DVR12_20500 [Chitinophaga silvatica]|uniref:Uncharacterized protein n=1 Tax=Chitinophaga silvatica TaxID=2282649 RepID=A0A3E1Y5S8_9BACT|nr:hypothetical protein [Chitinophaga silvatica]RFS20100.1 hypothetical protein DVR12_20500 [Chitinophaga silvatica]